MEEFCIDERETGYSLLYELWRLDKGLLGAQPGGSCSCAYKGQLQFGQVKKRRRRCLHCLWPHTKILVWAEDGVVLSVKPRASTTGTVWQEENNCRDWCGWQASKLQMSARQAEVQAPICVLLGEKKSLVLSALTVGGKLVGCDSRVEEQQWHLRPEDVLWPRGPWWGQKCVSV